ncbi:DUF2169 domain-containing protein [Variovorax sp. J22R133]|uniref:DUF2169 family type VI secretion system accessory protein n=1 Tax=Variovorax brevis TaxID=3053503 RepID=UPI002575209A|nr:DUF2169 domain-containing protein [Variovorax sp. J22R133]MDM0112268.1 DUF2169 domain-containing protein [Variovorax sp. J22R133]
MWAINNRTAYQAGNSWTRDKDGVHVWLVAVKASFDILSDGRVQLADEQLPALLAPEYHGEPGASSLRYDADLVAPKPTTDILVNGSAHAPGGRPSTEFTVGLRVGPIQKVLRVRGDRTWNDGPLSGRPSSPTPVTQVPLTYERAYGGYDHQAPDPRQHRLDARNPVGRGVIGPATLRAGLPLPNFEYPNGNLEKDGPAGFGAIDGHWSPRRELAGTYDDAWKAKRLPLLPEDWDAHSLQCAPVDQRPENPLRGGEPVELANLSVGGSMRFVLPRIHLTFTTRIDRRIEEHRARLSSVIIEPDHPRVIMVWSTSLLCRTDCDYLDETVIREKRIL